MPTWHALPPEVNSARLTSGPAAAPMAAAAEAYAGLATAMEAQAAEVTAAMGELSSTYVGASGTANQASHMPYIAWLHTTAAQLSEAAARASSQAAAHSSAVAMMPPLPAIAANRAAAASLQSANIATGGLMTGAVMANEAAYMEMWLQAAAAMDIYAAQTSANLPVTASSPAQPIVGGQGASPAQAAYGQGMSAGQSVMSSAGQAATQMATRTMQSLSALNGAGSSGVAGRFGSMLSTLADTGKVGPGSAFSQLGFSGSRLASPLIGEPAGLANASGMARSGAYGANLGVMRGAMPQVPSFTMPAAWSSFTGGGPSAVPAALSQILSPAATVPSIGDASSPAIHHAAVGTHDGGQSAAAPAAARPPLAAGFGEEERTRPHPHAPGNPYSPPVGAPVATSAVPSRTAHDHQFSGNRNLDPSAASDRE